VLFSRSHVSVPDSSDSRESDVILGQTVGGRFRIEKRLAAGGMGVVYKAEQVPLGRPVAVKILRQPPDPQMDDSFSRRFLLEAAAVANLNHPNTIVVHDYGRDGEHLYFAMEYLEGKTLTERVREGGPLPPEDAVHVALQIASSLKDAHDQGLVHRDLKPGNVMLTTRGGDPRFVKVLDFGLVKIVTQQENLKLTQSGIMLGSPRYMSPEQVRGTDLDHRADIYSFGALLFFALTRSPPFPTGSQFEAMRAHVYTPAPKLRDLYPECEASERLEAVVRRCLEKNPDARFAHFGEVIDALEHCRLAPRDSDVREDLKPTTLNQPNVAEDPSLVVEHAPPRPHRSPEPSGDRPAFSRAPAPPPQHPPQTTQDATAAAARWALRIGVVLIVVGLAAFAAILIPGEGDAIAGVDVRDDVEGPHAPVVEPTVEAMEPLPTEPAAMAPTTMAPVAPGVTHLEVQLTSTPAHVRVRRLESDLGDTPLTLRMPIGQSWQLELSAPGYETRTVDVSADQVALSVELRRVRRGVRPDQPITETAMDDTQSTDEPTTTTTTMGMETGVPIRDPWSRR